MNSEKGTGQVVRLIVKNPYDPLASAITMEIALTEISTVKDIKLHIEREHPSKAEISKQRLIFFGKILSDTENLKSVFSKCDLSMPQVMHLLVQGFLGNPSGRSVVDKPVDSRRNVTSPSIASVPYRSPDRALPEKLEEKAASFKYRTEHANDNEPAKDNESAKDNEPTSSKESLSSDRTDLQSNDPALSTAHNGICPSASASDEKISHAPEAQVAAFLEEAMESLQKKSDSGDYFEYHGSLETAPDEHSSEFEKCVNRMEQCNAKFISALNTYQKLIFQYERMVSQTDSRPRLGKLDSLYGVSFDKMTFSPSFHHTMSEPTDPVVEDRTVDSRGSDNDDRANGESVTNASAVRADARNGNGGNAAQQAEPARLVDFRLIVKLLFMLYILGGDPKSVWFGACFAFASFYYCFAMGYLEFLTDPIANHFMLTQVNRLGRIPREAERPRNFFAEIAYFIKSFILSIFPFFRVAPESGGN